jgi:hypothetical protein
VVDSTDATYAACRTDPALSPTALHDLGDLEPGASICLETTAGRVAVLTVVGEVTPREVTLDVTVWEEE